MSDIAHKENTYVGRSLDVAARVLLDAERLENLSLGTKETEREENELRGEELLRARNLLHLPASSTILSPFDTNGVQTLELAILIDDEILGGNAVLARIYAAEIFSFGRQNIQ